MICRLSLEVTLASVSELLHRLALDLSSLSGGAPGLLITAPMDVLDDPKHSSKIAEVFV